MASVEDGPRGGAGASSRRRIIVDAQVHLWTAEAPDRPWPPGGAQRAQLPEPFTYGRLLPMMDSTGVDCAIIVPPSFEGDRNVYALEAVRAHPRARGARDGVPADGAPCEQRGAAPGQD